MGRLHDRSNGAGVQPWASHQNIYFIFLFLCQPKNTHQKKYHCESKHKESLKLQKCSMYNMQDNVQFMKTGTIKSDHKLMCLFLLFQ